MLCDTSPLVFLSMCAKWTAIMFDDCGKGVWHLAQTPCARLRMLLMSLLANRTRPNLFTANH
eukprot:SAG25_NODE_34_length_20232_cov_4.725534_2_plen_62_part_00